MQQDVRIAPDRLKAVPLLPRTAAPLRLPIAIRLCFFSFFRPFVAGLGCAAARGTVRVLAALRAGLHRPARGHQANTAVLIPLILLSGHRAFPAGLCGSGGLHTILVLFRAVLLVLPLIHTLV